MVHTHKFRLIISPSQCKVLAPSLFSGFNLSPSPAQSLTSLPPVHHKINGGYIKEVQAAFIQDEAVIKMHVTNKFHSISQSCILASNISIHIETLTPVYSMTQGNSL